MKQGALVSVAMCTYNGAPFLAGQLDTLVNQTYKFIEIVVVDDCSTDETFEILTAYAAKHPQLNIFQNKTNLGFIENFERAVSLCKGELIALCDQDDLWHPQKIELQVNGIEDNIFIYHDSEFIHEDGKNMNKKMSDLVNFYRGGVPEVFLFFNCVSGHSILMKRVLLDYALPLKKDFFHDWWLAYVATNIGTIDFIPQCLIKYRQHDKSETNILGLRREKDNYNLSSHQNFVKILKWLNFCISVKSNKSKVLTVQIYNACKKRLNSYVSFDLSWLLIKHWKTIFYIRKKPLLSNLNYVMKQVFGFKLKNLLK